MADPTTGALEVSYRNIRSDILRMILGHQLAHCDCLHSWSRIRQIEGWAGLQHHSVLHTAVTIFPPTRLERDGSLVPPRLNVNFVQGSFFTILPRSGRGYVPRWYSGNIYGMRRSMARIIDLPSTPSLTSPTIYDVFVSGDYEVYDLHIHSRA